MSCPDCQARIAELEKRILALEANVFKTRGLTIALHTIIHRWPGPFTAQQVREVLYERYPEFARMENHSTVETKIHRMVKQNLVTITQQGLGPHPTIYEITGDWQPGVKAARGQKRGGRHDYETGFRSVVRHALDHLPAHFKLTDLKAWVAANLPDLRVPDGSWSSTLHKLVETEELTVVKYPHRGKTLKEYARTAKRVAPSGEQLNQLQQAYREFRNGLQLEPLPDFLAGIERHES